METNQQDILEIQIIYHRASSTQRFFNYVIDIIFYWVIMFVINVFLALFPVLDLFANTGVAYGSLGFAWILSFLWSSFLIALYYFIVESIGKGRTLGKLITGTKVAREDGAAFTTVDILKRSLVRIIPFNALSGLGSECIPWHDRWTNTLVIDIKQSSL